LAFAGDLAAQGRVRKLIRPPSLSVDIFFPLIGATRVVADRFSVVSTGPKKSPEVSAFPGHLGSDNSFSISLNPVFLQIKLIKTVF
jgi:hypothetical protein